MEYNNSVQLGKCKCSFQRHQIWKLTGTSGAYKQLLSIRMLHIVIC